MTEQMIKVCQNILEKCLQLQEKESFLVVTDETKEELARLIYEAGQKIGAESMLVLMKNRQRSGEEPPAAIAAAMKSADAVVCITECSLTHTKARKEAVASGTRIATMPGISKDMFLNGAITADYDEVQKLTYQVKDVLDKGRKVTINKDGYTFSFSIEGRESISSTGVYVKPGESGNLPSGEAFIAPVEGTANGQLLIDGSIVGIGKIKSPIILTVEKGRLVEAEGENADKLLELLGNELGRSVGEFGIGTNKSARITGNVLEDEKVYKTVHIAFGSNLTFGGIVEAGVHIDCVFNCPDVIIDDHIIFEKGIFKE
ncbi:aminopeptidase [Sporolactobacillus terrae]|uniref:Aminopeptidase n=1 Tax=Sporolactobacillus terrae TaxID=269673 RepID=A0ABX5Q4R0_9BACL|nr:aminopeptidase [Sporolactobacillus terrae]QAA21633.1 aminopeptidase [Sporolactobacillus terrae]QAA24605.1 aminopeptidase [Sporolactobacillus terrae]UAK16442.1 aminopeptidase [Sporolactobacillus terrae]